MSYQVIARKWRPQTFEEVTGQEHITRTLRNAIEFDRLHHAYLFSGARGVGKTTTARLLAKALNCHKAEGPTVSPCSINDADACPSCVEISESRSIDVLEFDAASHTKVEEIRQIILEGINITPARDRYKVFIIDEVHMLSASSFNALLKTLEEPPPNVAFVMATTELHKVPDTILSRCQEFQFRTISRTKIFDRLRLIADAEGVSVADDALSEIARSGNGSMRDAQSNFDQVISFSAESITVPDVTAALGMASTEMLTRVLDAISETDPRAAIEVVDELVSRGHDLRNFCRDLMSLVRDLLVFKVSGADTELLEGFQLPPDQFGRYTDRFSESDLIRMFNSVAEVETSLKDATQPRYALELGLVKIIEAGRLMSIADILKRLAVLEGGASNGTAAQPQAIATPIPKATPATPHATQEKKTLKSRPEPVSDTKEEAPDQLPSDLPELPEDFEDLAPDLELPDERSYSPMDTIELDSLPTKLPPISSEMLEHVDDKYLDAAFEQSLLRSGDDLRPIQGAAAIVASVMSNGSGGRVGGSNGTATAPARDLSAYAPPAIDDDDEPVEIPVLSADPTDEELLEYAKAHPLVRKTMRIFRAKIVEVTRTGSRN